MTLKIVLDATVLGHFARARLLTALEDLLKGYEVQTTPEVIAELQRGVKEYPDLAHATTLEWVEVVELESLDELYWFATYKAQFGDGPEHNNGEAAVLARVAVHGDVALIDERAATRAGERDGLVVHGTLWLIINGFRAGLFDRAAAESMVDALGVTEMRLPVDGAGLFAWAYVQGLLP